MTSGYEKVLLILEMELALKGEAASVYFLTFLPHDKQKAASGDS